MRNRLMGDPYRLPEYKEDFKQNFFLRGLLSLVSIPLTIIVIAIYAIILNITGIINLFTVMFTKKIWKKHYDLTAQFAMWQADMSLYINGAVEETPIRGIPTPCKPPVEP